jgi:CheY-like chemotaxis protein/anti-sigma regulatory factor (Ser/Thr protein kinase)
VERATAARIAAEQASAAKDRFLAILSHELRSPLSTILGWAQILSARTDLPENSRRAIQTIERNARAQAQLIGELLDISRIVTGKLHLELDVVGLRAVVESAVASVRMDLNKKLDVRAELPAAEVFVNGDATRLMQVVMNLLNNAVKFTDAGGSVVVALREDGDQVELSVSDTGIGIAPNQIGHIFDLFQQGDTTLKRRKGGLGLGTAIAKQLVEAHGGVLRVESDGVDCGAKFTARLPCATSNSASEPPGFAFYRELSDIRILVVDDEPDIIDLMRHLLEREGAFVKTAETATAALKVLEGDSFDVLVSDIGLPEQDGFALIREIRARGLSGARMPAIALTGYAGQEYAHIANAAGFQLHLAKPVDARELISAVVRLRGKALAEPS